MRIIGVGASVLDTVITMDHYPVEDFKAKADNVFTTGGGPVGNALVAISKLGVDSAYLGLLSKDAMGDQLINEYKKYGVDTSLIKQVEGTKAFTSFIVLNTNNGSRTCLFDRGNVPDDPSMVDFSSIKEGDILHLDGNYINIAIEAAKVAKANNVLVSLDAGGLYNGIESLLPYVDILIPSEEFATKITNSKTPEEAIIELNKRYSPKILVVTCGSKGGIYLENGEVKTYPAFKIKCVDSNGAGDTFHGAFLVGYTLGYSVYECCRFASATSAIKCTKEGVRVALPNREEVINFLKNK